MERLLLPLFGRFNWDDEETKVSRDVFLFSRSPSVVRTVVVNQGIFAALSGLYGLA